MFVGVHMCLCLYPVQQGHPFLMVKAPKGLERSMTLEYFLEDCAFQTPLREYFKHVRSSAGKFWIRT